MAKKKIKKLVPSAKLRASKKVAKKAVPSAKLLRRGSGQVRASKKVTKKPAAAKAKAGKKAVKALPKRKPIGEVTHFFDKICVAVVKFNQGVAVGEEVCFEGPKGAFSQILNSMQYEHESIDKVKKGQEVGVKTKKPVREGHKVYRA